jgi:hypothetical protein
MNLLNTPTAKFTINAQSDHTQLRCTFWLVCGLACLFELPFVTVAVSRLRRRKVLQLFLLLLLHQIFRVFVHIKFYRGCLLEVWMANVMNRHDWHTHQGSVIRTPFNCAAKIGKHYVVLEMYTPSCFQRCSSQHIRQFVLQKLQINVTCSMAVEGKQTNRLIVKHNTT